MNSEDKTQKSTKILKGAVFFSFILAILLGLIVGFCGGHKNESQKVQNMAEKPF